MMQVRLMFARGMVGMIEASTTRRLGDSAEPAVLVDDGRRVVGRAYPRRAAGVEWVVTVALT
jgi:hypothetical protein